MKRKNTRKKSKRKKSKRKKSKRKKRSRSQKGGFCPICLVGPLVGVTGLGTAGYMATRKK